MVKSRSTPFKVQNSNKVKGYHLFYSVYMSVLKSIIKQEKYWKHIRMGILLGLWVSPNKYYENFKYPQINLKVQWNSNQHSRESSSRNW